MPLHGRLLTVGHAWSAAIDGATGLLAILRSRAHVTVGPAGGIAFLPLSPLLAIVTQHLLGSRGANAAKRCRGGPDRFWGWAAEQSLKMSKDSRYVLGDLETRSVGNERVDV